MRAWLTAVIAVLGTLGGASAAHAQVFSITEFTSGLSANSEPLGMAAGPDGNVWFTQIADPGRIGRITPSGEITEVATGGVTSGFSADGRPFRIALGPDGNMWFTETSNATIGRITPTGTVTEFSSGVGPGPSDITVGPDGNMWFTEFGDPGRVMKITTAGVVTEVAEGGVTPGFTANSSPSGITAGPDGNLWFIEFNQAAPPGRVAKITPEGAVTEYSGLNSRAQKIARGPDGNLWFTEFVGNRIGRITPSGVLTEFTEGITENSGPRDITLGPDGNLWFTEWNVFQIARITPTGTVTEFSTGITEDSQPNGITAGPDGNIWFTEQAANAIGRILLPDIRAPETAITEGPSGTTSDTTPTFGFVSSELGSTFLCGVDGAAPLACTSPFTTATALSLGAHTFQVQATDAAGNLDLTPATQGFTIVLPDPVLGRTINAVRVSGTVQVSPPPGGARASARVPGVKGRNFTKLGAARQFPVGTYFDTRKGSVRITSARNAAGATQSGVFRGGVFQVVQSRSKRGLTELRLKGFSFKSCKKGAKRTVRKLRAKATGRWRTRGRKAHATVRGTTWTMADRCDGTLTKVKAGRVAVRDLGRKRTIVVKKGKRYLAR